MIVIPTILEKELDLLFFQIQKMAPHFKTFQIDIADGQFVPNHTVSVEEITRAIQNGRYPINNKYHFDFHLMVTDVKQNINDLKKLNELINIDNVLIHYPRFAEDFEPVDEFSLGLVLNPENSVLELKQRHKLNSFPIIQIMTVVPGFQGSPFIPEMLKKIDQLRNTDYKNKIYLDGGINDQTLPIITSQKNLPDVLCVGSYLTQISINDSLKNRLLKLSSFPKNHPIG